MTAAVIIARNIDFNPITILLLNANKKKAVDEIPPAGYQLITDERNRILRDEQRNYLIDRKEVQ